MSQDPRIPTKIRIYKSGTEYLIEGYFINQELSSEGWQTIDAHGELAMAQECYDLWKKSFTEAKKNPDGTIIEEDI